jgi:hypothetical protein
MMHRSGTTFGKKESISTSAPPVMLTASLQSVAPSFGMGLSPINLREVGEIERAVAAFARSPNGGLIQAGAVWA